VYTVLIESFIVNQTAKSVNIYDCAIEGSDDDERSFCHALSHVFKAIESLERFCLPAMDINAENGLMNVLIGGVGHNKTVHRIDFEDCHLDQAALSCLEGALVESPRTLSVSSVGLSIINTEIDLKPFLRSLPRMPLIKAVTIYGSLDAECKQLLLQAAKKKKTLRSLNRFTDEMTPLIHKLTFI
jgi:hypothetical protein